MPWSSHSLDLRRSAPRPEAQVPAPTVPCACSPPSALTLPPVVQRQQLELSHFLDCVPKSLAAAAGRLHTSIRHVVDTKRRDVVDDQASGLELVECLVDDAQIVREEPCLQPELARTGSPDRACHVVVSNHSDNGCKDLF